VGHRTRMTPTSPDIARESGSSPTSQRRGSALVGLLRAMRPHHWTKNLFVFAPLLFSHEVSNSRKTLHVAAAFAVFCLLASGVYLMNDVADLEKDRLHPRKRNRPIARGDVSVNLALSVAGVLVIAALVWAFQLHVLVGAIAATYFAVQILYTFRLKRVVIVDVMCIASGFVLRMLAGSSAAWVTASAWIIVCTIFLSLFLALCKRRHESVSLGGDASQHRAILADYPPALLDQLIGVVTACTIVTYALYTVDERTIAFHGLRNEPWLAATVPFVIFGLFRYLFLVHRRDEGGSPTRTLLRDVPLIVNGVLYGLAVLLVFRFARS
jgi:4-hydroxybenzoate polyprenyltransferase